MGNVYSLKCPELKIDLRVGINGQLFKGIDRQGREYHGLLTKFLYACKGKEIFYVGENANNGAVDDVTYEEFDPERNYEDRPVVSIADGWAKPTTEQLSALTEAVVKGTLGYVHGVELITDVFREPKP